MESDVAKVEEVINKHTKSHGSLCFVVRRPGELIGLMQPGISYKKSICNHAFNMLINNFVSCSCIILIIL